MAQRTCSPEVVGEAEVEHRKSSPDQRVAPGALEL
jgi:hypothetical protein